MLRNHIPIYTEIDGILVSNFFMDEFENAEGWIVLHHKIPWALENIRAAMNARYRPDVISCHVTNTTRTKNQLDVMGHKWGWIDQGGKVARRSFHLVEYGGIAVDFYLRNRTKGTNIPPKEVAKVAELYFDFVKPYDDGHIHGDFRTLANR
jgi:hypothetical protein